ncbi:MAG: hypothetical protein ACLTTJ_14355 [Blautia sp.]
MEERPSFRMNFVKTAADWIWLALRSRYIIRLSLMVIMLRTNDCKNHYRASASLISKGLDQVIRKARLNASQHFDLLVISPIHLGHGVGESDFGPEFDEITRLFPEILPLNTARLHSRIMLLS